MKTLITSLVTLFALTFGAIAFADGNTLVVSPKSVEVKARSSYTEPYSIETIVHGKQVLKQSTARNPESIVNNRNIVLVTAMDQGKKVSIDLRTGEIIVVDQLDTSAPNCK